MKTILHSDYWVEVPAGEFLAGISLSQSEQITQRMQAQYHWDYFPKWLDHKNSEMGRRRKIIVDSQSIWLKQFYISRFPITSAQVFAFGKGKSAADLPGALEEDAMVKSIRYEEKYHGRQAAMMVSPEAEALCKELGARLPSDLEWEKAARGIDGRLYPWGNEWDLNAGFFYYRTEVADNLRDVVDAFPNGVSPYGVWNMIGSLPQMVGTFPHPDGRGCMPSLLPHEQELAWLDNIIPFAFKVKDYISLRPVLDKWPQQQWTGHKTSE